MGLGLVSCIPHFSVKSIYPIINLLPPIIHLLLKRLNIKQFRKAKARKQRCDQVGLYFLRSQCLGNRVRF